MTSPATPQSNYQRYMQADFNRPTHYPVDQTSPSALYHPAATWLGRLILPPVEQRQQVMGALFEVYHADSEYAHLVGQVVRLRWTDRPETHKRFWSVTRQVIFDEASNEYAAQGIILPERVNNWPLVNPFESLAGSLPDDMMIVRLRGPVEVAEAVTDGPPIIYTPHEPVQTTGRFYGLVRFLGPADDGPDCWRVVHFEGEDMTFTGPETVVRLPAVVNNLDGVSPIVNDQLEASPANEAGWYIFGAPDYQGVFVVQSLMPRGLVRLQPDKIIADLDQAKDHLKPKDWQQSAQKGTFQTVLLSSAQSDAQTAHADWQVGDAALLIHMFGGIGGQNAEGAARSPLYWGHFAFGIAHVIREPLAAELIFDIIYHQIYIPNIDGVISGAQHWTRYTGDRQFGWLGTRPTQDILIRLGCFTDDFELPLGRRSALDELVNQLEEMTARYRIADGRGGVSLSAANNCSQDSNQALYAAIKRIEYTVRHRADFQDWLKDAPDEAARLERLLALGEALRRKMLPLGAARADWDQGATMLSSSLSENSFRAFGLAIRSWRTMLPSVAVRAIASVFLDHGASAWVLRTNQVGGIDPTIEPRIPNV